MATLARPPSWASRRSSCRGRPSTGPARPGTSSRSASGTSSLATSSTSRTGSAASLSLSPSGGEGRRSSRGAALSDEARAESVRGSGQSTAWGRKEGEPAEAQGEQDEAGGLRNGRWLGLFSGADDDDALPGGCLDGAVDAKALGAGRSGAAS